MADSGSEDEYESAEEGPLKDEEDQVEEDTKREGLNNPVVEQLKEYSPDTCQQQSNLSENLENIKLNEPIEQSNVNEEDTLTEERVGESEATEYVSNLDNKYISEATEDVNEEKVELTEEQIKEMKEQAGKLKASGNEAFKNDDTEKAIELYSEAIKLYPSECNDELAICYANRAACNIKLENHDDVVQDCTKALELRPDYLKALMRRAQSNEALDKLEEALQDYKKALELDPSQSVARHAVFRLPEQIKEQQEKMKAEMIGKLKELGNVVLKPFGLSTNNFQLQQDPNTGGYSVNFKS